MSAPADGIPGADAFRATPTRVLRSLAFSVGLGVSTLVLAVAGMLTAPFPYRVRLGVIGQWTRFNAWWLRVTCGVGWVVEGRENIPATNGIVLSKHQSTWETLFLSNLFRPPAWVLKRELLWLPFFGWALALLQPVAIDRKAGRRALKQLVDQGQQRLEAGRWVLIFPEGHRMPPGQSGRYHSGGAMLASRTGYPVVPVAHNAGSFWPRGRFIKRPGTIRVVIGPPIRSAGRRAELINAEARDWIEGATARLEGREPSE